MTKKIAYLGMGIWGFCLARLLANKGFNVTGWARNPELINTLIQTSSHPLAPNTPIPSNLTFTNSLNEAIENSDIIVEGVSVAGLRPVLSQIKAITELKVPLVLTSKGIEQNTSLLVSDVVLEIFGPYAKDFISCLSGPSIAKEVLQDLPCSVVVSAYNTEVLSTVHSVFSSQTFRVYPNNDLKGVCLGGALKNIIAIACGISSGFNFGDNARAGLITRGLHEIRRFASILNCRPETMNGLAGLGDLCVTCFSEESRNFRFGKLIAQGKSFNEAKKEIGMVVEGAYTAVSAHQIALHHNIEMPITSSIYKVLYEDLPIKQGIATLMQRNTKEEYL